MDGPAYAHSILSGAAVAGLSTRRLDHHWERHTHLARRKDFGSLNGPQFVLELVIADDGEQSDFVSKYVG